MVLLNHSRSNKDKEFESIMEDGPNSNLAKIGNFNPSNKSIFRENRGSRIGPVGQNTQTPNTYNSNNMTINFSIPEMD